MNTHTTSPLYRASEDRAIAGVCGALARTLKLDVTFIRVAFVLTTLVSFGLAFWAYVALWALTPTAPGGTSPFLRATAELRRKFAPAEQATTRIDNS